MPCWSTFGARMSHVRPHIHKTHHGPNLGEATTFPLIVYSVTLHEAHIQMTFCPGTPKWESRNCQSWNSSRLCRVITSCAIWSGRGLNQSCSLRWELFNGMLHITCTQGNRVDSRLLVFRSQTANLTSNLSFGHNLCFRCSNGSCEPTLDIYVPRAFQWCKELPNPMGFDPCNHFLKIWESIEIPVPKMGVHLGVWMFILTLSHTPKLPSWPAPL